MGILFPETKEDWQSLGLPEPDSTWTFHENIVANTTSRPIDWQRPIPSWIDDLLTPLNKDEEIFCWQIILRKAVKRL